MKYLCIIIVSLLSQFDLTYCQEYSDDQVVLPTVTIESESEISDYTVNDSTTGTKIGVPIKDTPLSVQVIDRDIIDDQRAEQLQDIVYNVSGVVPSDSVIIPFLIRGFRAEVLRDGFASSTALIINYFNEDLTNVQRVDFLKGPSSVLYGNTAAGGTINIITKQPLSEFYSFAEGTIASYEFYRGAIDISTPLTKHNNLFLRFNGSYRNSNSFRDFIYSERIFLAPELTWFVTGSVKFSLESEYFYVNEPFDDGIVAVGDKVADIPHSRNLGEPTDKTKMKSFLIKGVLESEITNSVKLINAFRYYRNSGFRDDHISVVLLPDNRTLERIIFDSSVFVEDIYTSQNDLIVNFNTGKLDHKLLTGMEYIREDTDNDAKFIPSTSIDIFDPVYGQELPIDPSVPLISRAVDIDDLGLYIQDFISFDQRLFILAGLRFDYLNQRVSDDVLNPGNPTRNKEENYELSPRLGILFWLTDYLSVYTNYSESFNSYAVRSFTFDSNFLKPEKTWQLEGGFKISMLNDALVSTISLYRITKNNALTPDPINGIAFAIQVEEERSQGFEFDLSANPIPGLNLIASYSFIDAEVVKDDFFPSGNKLAAVPENSGSLWATYRLNKGVLNGFGVGAGFIGVGDREGDLENSFKLDGFIRIDTAIYYERELSNKTVLNASVNFKNITDEKYIVTSDSRLTVYPGTPFSVFGNIKVEFF